MRPQTRQALVDSLGRFAVLVEVGIGRRTDVAEALAGGGEGGGPDREVRATDVVEREVPTNVQFALDDVTAPDPSVYEGAEAIYALDLPPELHRAALAVAEAHDAVFAFTTLGGDAPEVTAEPETLPGETLFWASGASPEQGTERARDERSD